MGGGNDKVAGLDPEEVSKAMLTYVPQKVPNLAYWAEKAQEELDIGRSMNIEGLHTVICIDTSDSMKHGAAWEQTKQFFIQFIQGLKEVEEVDQEFVALSVFGQEVKVVQRLTNNYISLLEAFSLLKLGGPTPLYGGLLMALAGVTSLMTGVTRGVEIASRVILVTDGYPTDPLLIAGSDVCNPKEMIKNQLIAVQAVEKISSKKVRLDCVPVGEANSTFFDLLATRKHAEVYSYKDGRKLARRAINSFHAGHILEQWEHARVLGTSLGKEISLEDVWDMLDVTEIPSLSPGEKEEVLEIAKASLKKDDVTEGQQRSEDIFEKYNYEFDDPDIMLPPLGTRVRRGPDWIKGQEDSNGPGTITGHHKNRRQVHVEWDKNGKSDFYCYGDKGKYDVIIVDEPRILMSDELIATGCIVRRGMDWRWENQDGAPGATGVVIKVRDDGLVMVRWANKTKNLYRYSAGGKFDLDICPVESQIAGVAAQLEPPYTPESVLNRVQNKYHNESLKLPPLGTRVRRRVSCNKDQQDGNGPGTIIGHNESQNQVCVEWDWSGQSGFYCFKDMDTSEVVVVDEPRVLQPYELIATGCHVKQGKDWIYGNENGTPDAVGVVLNVREDGMALVRWPNKFKRYYRYDSEGYLDLDICNPDESQKAKVAAQPWTQSTPWLVTQSTPRLEEILNVTQETHEKNLAKEGNTDIDMDHYEIDDPNIALPSLGTRVRRGPDWNRGFEDDFGPGTIIRHHDSQKQVKVEWDKTRCSDFYRYGDLGKYDVLINSEPRVLQSELIATGCLVRRGKSWTYRNDNSTPDAIGIVLNVREDGMVLVRWPNKSKRYYSFFDLEICTSCDNSFEDFMPDISMCGPTLDSTSAKPTSAEKGRGKNKFLKKKEANIFTRTHMSHEASSTITIHEQTESNILQKISDLNVQDQIASCSSSMSPTTLTIEALSDKQPESTSKIREAPTTTTSNMPSLSATTEMPTTSTATVFGKATTDPQMANSTVAIVSTAMSLATAIPTELRAVPVGVDKTKHIFYKKEDLLGHGCDGTYVYRGKFDERDVAVKRLVKENINFADKERKLLLESDQHPNVIRYFWMEEEVDFICIALELCEGNLQDYVEDKLKSTINIEPIKLVQQALSGIAHLHSLGIVHRDIKPQNILISKPNPQGEVKAMISDFGFSKKLPSSKMSFSARSNVLGTEGWMSPEMLESDLKKTNAVDIFSAGCLIHYVLTKGLHPFGKRADEIQYNIRQGKFSLDRLPLTSDGFIAKDIIEKMLSADPKSRPTAKALLNHLLFWTKTEKLQFIEATSDWIVVKMVHKLETNSADIVRVDWMKHLSKELQKDIQKDYRERSIRYSGLSVKDLLRVIRNKRHHYNKMPEDVRKSVGSPQDEYLDYFTSRFPLLLLHTYRTMECCAMEDTFKTYYKTE